MLPISLFPKYLYTICLRSSDQVYIVIYYTKWVTTSWTHSIYISPIMYAADNVNIFSYFVLNLFHSNLIILSCSITRQKSCKNPPV